MPISISPLEQVRLTTTFVDEDPDTGDAFPIAADSVALFIYRWDTTAATPGWVGDPPGSLTVNAGPNGSVYYDWVPTVAGKFRVVFQAIIQLNNTVTDERIIYVGPIATTKTLPDTQTYYFMGELDPIYIDPYDILRYYPDGDLIEITEWINWYSEEVKGLLKISDGGTITPQMHDYIVASVLCEMSRIYTFSGEIGGTTTSSSFTLGDLRISDNDSTTTKTKINTDTATTWCELAAQLRKKLTAGKATFTPVFRGSAYVTPIPDRTLRRID